MKLSPHFDLAEFEVTHTGLPNDVPPGLIPNLQALCEKVIEPIRARFGPVTINSGYRAPAVNAAVGGAPTSQHAKGEAADLDVAGRSNMEVATWIRDHLQFDQLIAEGLRANDPRAGWIHVSWSRAHPPRLSILTMTMAAHGPVYTPGLPRLG